MKTQRTSRLSAALAVVVLGAVGCGKSGGEPGPPVVGGGNNDAGSGRVVGDAPPVNEGDAQDGVGREGGASAAMVSVNIVSPAMDSFVRTHDRFVPEIVVRVTTPPPASADMVDTLSVEVWDVAAPDKAKMVVSAKMFDQTNRPATGMAGVADYRYASTPIDLSPLGSGLYELRATAVTVGGARGMAVRDFRGDAGPLITIIEPQEGKSYKGSIVAQILIQDALFPPIQDVAMTIGDNVLPLAPPEGNQWTVTINFNDYMPPLDGDQLFKVVAANANGTKTTKVAGFKIDNVGPTLTSTTPKIGDLIGQVISVSATVMDPSGVIDSSVVAVFAHGPSKYEVKLLKTAMPGVYTAPFDTRVFPNTAIWPTVSFRASDELGNESSIGYVVGLDNMPPVIDLDPPNVYFFKLVDRGVSCSWPMDPVGPDAVDDGDLTAQLFDIRARIEDQGNLPVSGGADYHPVAQVPTDKPGAAELLILDDTTQPLVVDTDGDGLCDAINPLLVPTTTPMSSSDALLVNLAPLSPTGSPDYYGNGVLSCTVKPSTDSMPPEGLCPGTADNPSKIFDGHGGTMTYVMQDPHIEGKAIPEIWSIPPSLDKCGDTQLDALANNIKDGWACLAVVATDAVGNMQVSPPLRVCVDHDSDGAECPHRPIKSGTAGPPRVVETFAPHGLVNGDRVIIGDAVPLTQLNGHWTVDVVDATHFSLREAAATGSTADLDFGWFFKENLLPQCTGSQVPGSSPPKVNMTPCRPWESFVYTGYAQ